MLSSSSGRISDGLNDGKIVFRKYFRISGLIRQTYENAVNIAIELFFIWIYVGIFILSSKARSKMLITSILFSC